MKSRILSYNSKCSKTPAPGESPVSKSFLMSDLGHGEKAYDRVGQVMPLKLPGSKSYWSRQYLDLMAFCARLFCYPHSQRQLAMQG